MLLQHYVYQILVGIERKDSCLDFARFARIRPQEAARFFLLACYDIIQSEKPTVCPTLAEISMPFADPG